MKIKEAVIIVGGMGTRLLPYTKTISKEMMPIYDVPSIYILVKELFQEGIKKVIFVVTKHNKKLIENYFSKDKYLDEFLKDKPNKKKILTELNEIISKMSFTYVYQTIKGTYGALYSARKFIKNDYFLLMYGDDIIDNDISVTKQLIDAYNNNPKMYVTIKKVKDLPEVGIVKYDKNNNLVNLVNKNEQHNNSVIHGRMLLNKKIFSIKDTLYKHDNDEYYLTYALLKFKEEVKVLEYQGTYFNIGEKTGFIKASIYYALKDQNVKDDLLEYIKAIK